MSEIYLEIVCRMDTLLLFSNMKIKDKQENIIKVMKNADHNMFHLCKCHIVCPWHGFSFFVFFIRVYLGQTDDMYWGARSHMPVSECLKEKRDALLCSG